MLCTLATVQPGPDAFREMVQLANLQKTYFTLAKQFGLLPRERKVAKMDSRKPKQRNEFGI